MSDNPNIMSSLVNLLEVVHNPTKAVDEYLHNQVDFVQFKYCLDLGTCSLVLQRIQGFPHFRAFDCTQKC